jgi:hypothetical protein
LRMNSIRTAWTKKQDSVLTSHGSPLSVHSNSSPRPPRFLFIEPANMLHQSNRFTCLLPVLGAAKVARAPVLFPPLTFLSEPD